MIGELVYFHPGDCGEHLGMVVAQKPRTKAYVVVYASSAIRYKAVEVETVRPLIYDSPRQRRHSLAFWTKKALSRESSCSPRLKTLIREARSNDS